MRVAVVYDAFPHYRRGVIRALMSSRKNEYVFVGAKTYPRSDIATWWPETPAETVTTGCWQICTHWLLQSRLLQTALRSDIDALIFLGNPYFVMTWLAGIAGRLVGKPVLFWTHGWQRDECGAKDWVRQLFFRIPHGLLFYGERARALALARGFDPRRLYVIYNSLDYSAQRAVRDRTSNAELRATRSKLGVPADQPILVCTARLTKECQFEMLFDAAAILGRRGVRVHTVLVGDGPQRSELERYARSLSLGATFLGECYDEETIGPIVMSSVATVSPGKVGLTAIHSLAYGTPVITHSDMDAQRPEVEAVREGETGFLFRRDDVQDLARKIRHMVDIYRTPVEMTRMRRQCISVIEDTFNPEYQRTTIEQALQELS